MKQKKRIQVSLDADIVVFDLNTIQDKATFIAPAQLSEGFRYVIVNGVPIIKEGQRIGNVRPGKPIRRTL